MLSLFGSLLRIRSQKNFVHCFKFVALFWPKPVPNIALPKHEFISFEKRMNRIQVTAEIIKIAFCSLWENRYQEVIGRVVRFPSRCVFSFPLFCFTKKFPRSPTFNFNIAERVDWEIILRKISSGRERTNYGWKKIENYMKLLCKIKKVREAMKSEK